MAQKFASLKARRTAGNVFTYIFLAIVSIVWITPFVFLLLQSLRIEGTGPVGYIWPQKIGLDNYFYLFSPETGFL